MVNRIDRSIPLADDTKPIIKMTAPSSDDKLSDIHNRSDRIDALVKIAKQEYDAKKTYAEIIQRLTLEMNVNWSLSPGTQKGYLNSIRTKFEYNYGIKLQFNNDNFTEIENEAINGKSGRKPSKINIFRTIVRKLEGDDKIPVKGNILANELEAAGGFTPDEANDLIEKMNTNSIIYQSKPGYYNLV